MNVSLLVMICYRLIAEVVSLSAQGQYYTIVTEVTFNDMYEYSRNK